MAPIQVEAPLRILLLSSLHDVEVPLLKNSSTYDILTRYYTATVPIWRDNLPTKAQELKAWEEEWSNEQATEVIEAIGAYIVCLKQPQSNEELSDTRTSLRRIQETIAQQVETSYNAPDPLFIALLVRSSAVPTLDIGVDEWDDLCREEGGWEFIDARDDHGHDPEANPSKTNEYGEKIGVARFKESLEANDWESMTQSAAGNLDLDGPDNEADLDPEEFGDLETAQNPETFKEGLLQHARENEGEDRGGMGDEDVRALESMMLRLQAVREAGNEMSEAERKRLAMRTVKEVMKTL